MKRLNCIHALITFILVMIFPNVNTVWPQEGADLKQLPQWSVKIEEAKKLDVEFRGDSFSIRPPKFLKRVDSVELEKRLPKGLELQIWTLDGTTPSPTSLVVTVAPVPNPAQRSLEQVYAGFKNGISGNRKSPVDFSDPKKGKLGNMEGKAGKFLLPAEGDVEAMTGSYLLFLHNDQMISVTAILPTADEDNNQAKELRSAMLTIQALKPRE